jgi:hypothetical protein
VRLAVPTDIAWALLPAGYEEDATTALEGGPPTLSGRLDRTW